ncbi:MAG: hypothetical protein ACI8W8_002294 [Rhodothermales bacterium]|jgi:hypothetical protein
MNERVKIYEKRRLDSAARQQAMARAFNRVAFARLILFVLGVSIAFAGFTVGYLLGSILTIAAAFVFVVLMRRHEAIVVARDTAGALCVINDNELAWLEGREVIAEFANPEAPAGHPYASDLDLFGPGSLFEFCNRAETALGRQRLADWLQDPADIADISKRQEAVSELRNDIDWRQNLQAAGFRLGDEVDQSFLERFAEPIAKVPSLIVLLFVPTAFISVIVLALAGMLPPVAVGLMIVFSTVAIRIFVGDSTELYKQAAQLAETLGPYQRLLATIEAREFKSEALRSSQDALRGGGAAATAQLATLNRIVNCLAVRHNPLMHFPLNMLLLWDGWWIRKLDAWKTEHATVMAHWFSRIAEFEAVASLATLSYNHPAWTMPEILPDNDLVFAAEGLGHPMLPDDRRIDNDIHLTAGGLLLISGSNMAGKSTFERAVGVNAILAQAGGPVCARALRMTPLRCITSMRTQDSLKDNESTFYAELRRLKQVLDTVAEGERIIVLLDELLRGTNSRDQHAGVHALVRQLLGHPNAASLVATHDLELTALAEELGDCVRNVCFNSRIEGDKAIFDYCLRPGVCDSMNAVFLMRQMGIQIPDS